MNRGNFLRRTLSTLFFVSILFFVAVAHAEIYSGEGSYVMSEGESLGVAKERAKVDAMRNSAEKAFVYIKSYSRARNFELEEDIIETMTANILKLVENPHFYPLETVDNLEGVMIRVTVKVQIDDSDINRWLSKSEQQKSELVSQNEALRKANAEQERQIAELKRQLANNPQDKEEIAKKFTDEDKIFLSNQKVEDAGKLYSKGDYDGAIKLCNEAIELNADNELAYYGCGCAYNGLKQYERAIQYFDKSIQLNPNFAEAYNSCGGSYSLLGNTWTETEYFINKAIQYFDKALQLNPNFSEAYGNRGWSYARLGKYELAINDFDKVIELNPNDNAARTLRELCKEKSVNKG